MTAARLRASALAYIAKHSASRAMVVAVLERRAMRRLQARTLPEATIATIEAVVADLAAAGVVDDATFAAGRRATLERRGQPRRRIVAGLRQKGIDPETIQTVVGEAIDDLVQARRYAERRRLGPWSGEAPSEARRLRELRAMARAGFSYRVAVVALSAGGGV